MLREKRGVERELDAFDALATTLDDAEVLLELAREENDRETRSEAAGKLRAAESELERAELQRLLGGEHDAGNAILQVNAGAGGTDACDWAEMLLRMYARWAEGHEFGVETLDLQSGDEAGLRGATMTVKGDYAYGYLKVEEGVHRLVRISPYDAQSRRHTSFASVFVYPEIENDVEVEIRADDLEVDTFRASGAGGQHVNKTDSAVRIRHVPTGIVVQCQNERSQHRNRDNAMKILRARLYALKLEEERAKLEKMMEGQREIAWGSQIRSYVLHPYTMVKDHRTDEQAGDVYAVLDGDIDRFVDAYLHKFARRS